MNMIEREERLEAKKAEYIARGYKEIHSTRYSAVLEKTPIYMTTAQHAWFTLFTLGLWLVVWIGATMLKKAPIRIRIFVDPDGNVDVEQYTVGFTVKEKS